LGEGANRTAAGILVDEQFGAPIAKQAKADDLILAMPVEKSGQDEFDFEYGEEYGKHIEEFDPSFTKVLVRYNPDGDRAMNERQTKRLKELSDWLHDRGRKFLFELLVPATPEQLESAGGDADRFDKELRPKLMRSTIDMLEATIRDAQRQGELDSAVDARAFALMLMASYLGSRVLALDLGDEVDTGRVRDMAMFLIDAFSGAKARVAAL